MQDKLFQLALHLVPGVGNANAKQLISYCGSAELVFQSKKNILIKIPGIGNKTINSILQKSTFNKAERIIQECQKKEIETLHYTDKLYPKRLKQVYDAPNILYVKGNLDANSHKAISIVGTRKATNYGKKVTDEIVTELSSHDVTIVSGLAYGIDIQAHKQSIECSLQTIAILAGGLDKIYPKVHTKYVNQMIEKGGIISEYPPGTVPEAHQFPARNRIIAAMSDATIVVEAARRGGALITANIADSYNRPVFAVPGNLNQSNSEGCNNLIKTQSALIFTGIQDLAYYLNWDLGNKNRRKQTLEINNLVGPEKTISKVLMANANVLTIDELAWKSQIQINELASHLLTMEFQGLIRSLPGKKYELLV